MPLNLTEEQIANLAPDEASMKAARGLANTGKWVLREQSARALWGHCQGSGKTPYQTEIDLEGMAFKCSCPSRKFPCKHGLGLLLLYAKEPGLFARVEEPAWVEEWLTKRREKAEQKEQKEQKAATREPVDEAAQAKRLEKRHATILEGIDDLELWMQDLLRNGLLHVPSRAHSLFDTIARRMVDAQAPGLASRLRALQTLDYSQEKWQTELTERLSHLYLLMKGYRNLEALPPEWQVEVRTQIGYSQKKEEVLAGEAIHDAWFVLHHQRDQQEKIITDIHWLIGMEGGRMVKIVNFTPIVSVNSESWIPGLAYRGDICLYPGVGLCRRGLFKESVPMNDRATPACAHGLAAAAERYREAMIANPFEESVPLLVDGVRMVREQRNFSLCDGDGHTVALDLREEIFIGIMAITGGEPFGGFFLAHGAQWTIHGLWAHGEYLNWKDESN